MTRQFVRDVAISATCGAGVGLLTAAAAILAMALFDHFRGGY